MVFTDWTFDGTGSAALDAVTKYAGNSSLNFTSRVGFVVDTNTLTHNTFSSNKCQIICWVRHNYNLVNAHIVYIGLSTYGTLNCTPSAQNDWQKFRTSFWYDSTSNTKWGRIEKWNGSAWVQVGGDTNFGAGSPASGSLLLRQYYNGDRYDAYGNMWFDEVEVYS